MKVIRKYTVLFFTTFSLMFLLNFGNPVLAVEKWKIHDRDRPRPAIIQPAVPSTQNQVGQPPSDAIVLFGGEDLSQFRTGDNEPAKWRVVDGTVECVPGAGSIYTVKKFGDCQLHLEWATPVPAKGDGQGRGNSGVYLMGRYEVQILDSYNNITYADGQAAAIYGQYPPMVNASRPPGQWQTYDIVFQRPRFDFRGKVVKPARVTVFHNGVLVQNHVELMGPTTNQLLLPYNYHPDRLSLHLQNHKNPVRFRNIWIRDLETSQTFETETQVKLSNTELQEFVGQYKVNPN
jgi:hypothetical protein